MTTDFTEQIPSPWRDRDTPADAPIDLLPFIGATPVVHRGLLVHAPAIAGLILALLHDEPVLGRSLLDATWAPDDPSTPAQQARFDELCQWLARTALATDATSAEDPAWRDRVVELGDLALPLLPLLFTPDIIEAELGIPPDLGAVGALKRLTLTLKTSTMPAPLLAPLVITALIGDRVAGEVSDQLALPGNDERQLLRRLQERFDGWEAPTWADIIRVTFTAWREGAPWRRMLLQAQVDRLRAFDALTPEAQLAGEAIQSATDQLHDQVAQLTADVALLRGELDAARSGR